MSADTTSDSISLLPAPSLLHPLKNLAELVLASKRYPRPGDLQQRVYVRSLRYWCAERLGEQAEPKTSARRTQSRRHRRRDRAGASAPGRVLYLQHGDEAGQRLARYQQPRTFSPLNSPCCLQCTSDAASDCLFLSPPLPPVYSRARALARHGTPTERAVTIFQRHQEEGQYGENKERRRVQSRRESNNMNKSTNKNNKKDKKDKKNKKGEKK